jgi:hypoxanthine phosphoribosyltransferase
MMVARRPILLAIRSGRESPARRYLLLGLRTVDVLLTEAQIQGRVRQLGQQIEADYQGKSLTIVAVLTGSLIFLSDLIRQMHLPLRVALLQASSYRGAATTAGLLAINEAFVPDVAGRDVLLLDDILDTGHTLATLVDRMSERGAVSVRTAVLLRKFGRQEVHLEPDYCGFSIPDAFVVGYGLDYNDDYRHLPYVAVLPQRGEGDRPS